MIMWLISTVGPVVPDALPMSPQGRLAEYAARSVRILGDRDRVSLDERSWSLVLEPVRTEDAATYSCLFSSQSGGRRTVRLAVRGEASCFG